MSPIITIPAWMDRASCRDEDPGIFYPPPNGSLARARTICGECPCTVDCLAYILDLEGPVARQSRYGVFAGTSPRQRAQLAGGA